MDFQNTSKTKQTHKKTPQNSTNPKQGKKGNKQRQKTLLWPVKCWHLLSGSCLPLWPHLLLALYISLCYPSFLLHLQCIEYLLPCQLLGRLFPQHRWLSQTYSCHPLHSDDSKVTSSERSLTTLSTTAPPCLAFYHSASPHPALFVFKSFISLWNYIICLFYVLSSVSLYYNVILNW